jgi:hypothetical protein
MKRLDLWNKQFSINKFFNCNLPIAIALGNSEIAELFFKEIKDIEEMLKLGGMENENVNKFLNEEIKFDLKIQKSVLLGLKEGFTSIDMLNLKLFIVE